MPIKLVKRPRVSRRTHPLVQGELRHAYDVLGQAVVATLEEDVADWEHKPTFSYKVKVSSRQWMLTVSVDRRTKEGKIYTWVDEGTGEQGGKGEAYIITPVKAPYLVFTLPFVPKTKAASGLLPPSASAPAGTYYRQAVRHPGIDPRHFSADMVEHLKSRKSGSFHNVTEAGIKRAFRKLDIPV